MPIGHQIRIARQALGFSAPKLAALAEVSKESVYQMENGRYLRTAQAKVQACLESHNIRFCGDYIQIASA
jgi:DNA-binding XRE family transcriptional regulator